ncbi:MAG: response regulator [Chloroflexia bacterium]|nr:response regulator [Chloroflexia bacterium]
MQTGAVLQRWWYRLTHPRAADPDVARREYLTRVILLVLGAIAFVFALISLVGWWMGVIPLDTLLILVVMSLLLGGGLALAQAGHWRPAGYIPPALFLAIAAYGNYIGGVDAPAMLLYTIVIVLTAMLKGGWDQWLSLLLSLALYLGFAVAYAYGYLVPLRSAKTALGNRLTIVVACLVGITALLWFLQDQLQQALAKSRSHLRKARAFADELAIFQALAEHAADAILMGDTAGRLDYANRAAYELLGYDNARQELLGLTVEGLVCPQDRPQLQQVAQVWTGESSWNGDLCLRCRDGAQVDVNLTAFSVGGSGGEILRQAMIIRDITERQRLEVQLRQAQKMEAIGTLAGGVAHDFNNLLVGILGYASLLKLELDLPADSDSVRDLDAIVASASRASELTNQLLTFAQGGPQTEAKAVDLDQVIADVIRLLERTLDKSITIETRLDADLQPVLGDVSQIHQLLLNLCLNARDAMPDGGRLLVETAGVDVEGAGDIPVDLDPGPYVCIAVRDSGSGIEDDILPRIFDPFFSTKDQGRGLGLAIVYGIVHGHGGTIQVDSELGRGTRFSVYLPACREGIPLAPTEEALLFSGSETILVVDDELAVRAVLRRILERSGYTVLVAGDGQEAIGIYGRRAEEIDLVVLDMIMPHLGGWETFNRLRELDPQVRVLLSSGYSENGQAGEILAAGARGFLPKPYTLENVLQEVRRVLDS